MSVKKYDMVIFLYYYAGSLSAALTYIPTVQVGHAYVVASQSVPVSTWIYFHDDDDGEVELLTSHSRWIS